MNRVLVTGSSGQIGQRITMKLVSAGFHVIGIGTREAEVVDDSFQYIKFDLLRQDIDWLIKETRPHMLVHLAWETKPNLFWSSQDNDSWLNSSKRLINSFKNGGGEYIVVSGTGAEYNWKSLAPFSESSPELPESIYGQSKLALLHELRKQSTPFLWTRTFFQFGDKERTGRFIPSLIDSLLAGREFTIQKPRDIRDFIYVDDVVGITFSLIAARALGVFNVATGYGISVQDLGAKVASMMNCEELLNFKTQIGTPSIVFGDVAKLVNFLGPYSYTCLEEAIRRTIRERGS